MTQDKLTKTLESIYPQARISPLIVSKITNVAKKDLMPKNQLIQIIQDLYPEISPLFAEMIVEVAKQST